MLRTSASSCGKRSIPRAAEGRPANGDPVADDDPLAPFLAAQPAVVLDGGLASELERRGADLSDALWSAGVLQRSPESIRQVHLDYLQAGADVITCASYQATLDGFAAGGISPGEAVELLRLSVRLALEARDAFWSEPANRRGRLRPLVAASVGPYGAYLADGSEYRGDYGLGRGELRSFHRPRLSVLLEAGPDVLALETLPCKLEGEVLVDLLHEHPQARAWLSFSCRDARHVSHGETLADCVALADGERSIVAAGVNCSAPHYVEALLQSCAPGATVPLVAYPNRGECWDAELRAWRPGAVEPPQLEVERWIDAGARLVGGCCRTTPRDIARLRRRMLDRSGGSRANATGEP